jgi:hypothetical protein
MVKLTSEQEISWFFVAGSPAKYAVVIISRCVNRQTSQCPVPCQQVHYAGLWVRQSDWFSESYAGAGLKYRYQ